MNPKRRRPGSPKGQPKPSKRQLDDQFQKRSPNAALLFLVGAAVSYVLSGIEKLHADIARAKWETAFYFEKDLAKALQRISALCLKSNRTQGP